MTACEMFLEFQIIYDPLNPSTNSFRESAPDQKIDVEFEILRFMVT